ncbi:MULTISPECIES: HD domain-containing protein [Paenibacillus]|uniref:HD domain-containing protein n=1 Tax=Paenibacillus validus TaxID=44253 RepID=A0A7X2Z8S4_9BACL|nr:MULTISPECIES: HD domain-containing protein [Paenibacillus]MUG70428.1 HD domain-containing protein [Paenibacillus validus]
MNHGKDRYVRQPANASTCWEPMYRLDVPLDPLERGLLMTGELWRLHRVSHFGAAALASPVKHSRYEHTLGVWALAKTFFPEWRELHAAALLHDIGHLPFSHAVEKAIGQDHHRMTEQLILSAPIAGLLSKHGLSASDIVDLLNTDSPLTHRSGFLGLDHLDSFLRDTHAAGLYDRHPAELIRNIRFEGHVVSTDEETASHILEAVVRDHRIFLHPYHLALDALLSKAVLGLIRETPCFAEEIRTMTDDRLLARFESSGDDEVRAMAKVLFHQPHRLRPSEAHAPHAIRAEVRKLYPKQPLVNGVPLTELRDDAKLLLQELESLRGVFFYRID